MITSSQTVSWRLELKERELPSALAFPAVGVLASAGYYLGARIGFALTFQPHPISVLWPPNAILLATLLLVPVRAWWIVLLFTLPAHLAAEAESNVPVGMVLSWFVSNSFEAILGAMATRLFIGNPIRFDRVRDIIIFFTFGALLTAFVCSFLDAAFVRMNNWGEDNYWQLWRMRIFSNLFASVTIVPAIMAWKDTGEMMLRRAAGRAVEVGLLVAGMIVAIFVVFYRLSADAGTVPILLCTPLPFLFWATIRFGVRGVSATLLIAAILSIWSSAQARGPFVYGLPEERALSIQVFFILLALTLIPLSAMLRERKTMAEDLRASERRYREVVESQSELVLRCFAETTLTFVNESCCQYFQRSREELLGRKILDLVPATAHERILRQVAEVIVKRESITCEDVDMAQGPKGGWQQWIIHPIVGRDGHIREIQAIGRDISARRRVENALRETQERYRVVVDAQTEMISRFTPSMTLTFVNRAFCRFFGRTREQLIGHKLTELLPSSAREKIKHGVTLTISSRTPSRWDHAFTMPDESTRWQSWINYPILDGMGRVAEIQAVARDITDRKRAEEATRNLAHASRLAVVGELTAMIAHEVSQPLNAILNNVEAAQAISKTHEPSLEEIRTILEDIRADDLRAAGAVRRIRALSKRQEMEMQCLHLNSMVEEVLRLIGGDAGRRHVQVRTRFTPELPPVWGDPIHLQQVILNLIVNAMDAMNKIPEGDRLLTVTTSKKSEEELMVSVRDNGHGIAAEMTTRIFESFFSTKQDGIGLGLSIARSIVEAHGGFIWVENNADRGATFSFTLPRARHATFAK